MNMANIDPRRQVRRRHHGGARDRGLRQEGRSDPPWAAAAAAPGSQQDFVVNVGDRVFFDTDSSELSDQARATLDKQAQWLNNYNRYSFTIEGHADERGTREYNIALGARRAETVREYLISRGIRRHAHAHHLLRQGAAGRAVQRHFLLVAEPPRRDGARSELVELYTQTVLPADRRRRGADRILTPVWPRPCLALPRPSRSRIVAPPQGLAAPAVARYFVFANYIEKGSAMTRDRFARTTLVLAVCAGAAACGKDNQYAAPPPPKVTVAAPVEQDVTRYFEATGNTAAVNSVDLVARVQGFVQAISYTDGDFVKKGTSLFTIEPEPYKLKVEAAKAAVVSAQATLTQTQAEYDAPGRSGRQAGLDASQLRQGAGGARFRAGRSAIGAGQRAAGRDQSRLHRRDRAVRRRRDRAAGVDRAIGRRQLADHARDHRAARSDLGEFHRQRARRAAGPRHAARAAAKPPPRCSGCRSKSACKPKAAIRTTASSTTSRRTSIRRPERWRRAAVWTTPTARCCRAISCACAFPPSRSRHCWCPTSRSAATRAAAMCWSSTRTMSSSSARSSRASSSASLRVIEKGLDQGRPRGGRRHHARDSRPEGRCRSSAPRRPLN